MTAKEAREIVKTRRDAVAAEYEKNRKIRELAENLAVKALWEKRGEVLIEQINGFIKKAAAIGATYTYEPTSANPNGDSVIYLKDDDRPIKQQLIDHFKDQGFIVTDYLYGGLAITW